MLTIILNIIIYVVILLISSLSFIILSSLLCIILIALSLANLAFCNLVVSPDSLASVIIALVSSTSFPILSFCAIISASLFDKRRVTIGNKVFLAFCNIDLFCAFLAFLSSSVSLVLRFFIIFFDSFALSFCFLKGSFKKSSIAF